MRLFKNILRPSDGDVRIVVKFAWLPVWVVSQEVIWLEKFHEYQTYKINYDDTGWETSMRRRISP